MEQSTQLPESNSSLHEIDKMPSRRLHPAAGLLVPLVFIAVMYLFFPFREQFELDLDEGGNAMKAMLVARGYPLYTQVWSDQPPLLTYVLAAGFKLFGATAETGRTVVLVFSALLLASGFYFVSLAWGSWHALAGSVIVVLLPFYTTLSVSMMLALPALAFCGLSLLGIGLWHRHRQKRWLLLSALLLSLAVLTKIYTGILAPVFALGLLIAERPWVEWKKTWRTSLRPAFLWCITFSAATLGLALTLVGPANIGQLLTTHLAAIDLERYAGDPAAYTINGHLAAALPVLALAGLGLLYGLRQRNWLTFYLAGWGAAAYVLLFFHRPVWYHHQHLVTFPAALLAGIAAVEGLRLLSALLRPRVLLSGRAALNALALAGFILVLTNYWPKTYPAFLRPPYFITGAAHEPWAEQMFLVKMTNHAPQTNWVVTNLPMYAFRVGLPVPPSLAVMSEKRFESGELTEAQIIAIVEQLRPEQVLIGRREFPQLQAYLEQDYKLVYERGKRQYYLRKDLKE